MAGILRGARNLREWASPVLQNSAFLERGVLTPEEFVAAGDQLVYRCPTWAWASGEPSKRRPYLPEDKQYLVTKGVPCRGRATEMASAFVEDAEGGTQSDGAAEGDEALGSGWLETKIGGGPVGMAGASGSGGAEEYDEIETIGGEGGAAEGQGVGGGEASPPAGGREHVDGVEESGTGVGMSGGIDLAGAIVDQHFEGELATSAAESLPPAAEAPVAAAASVVESEDADEYADMSTFEEDNIVDDDEATLTTAPPAASMGGVGSGGYMVATEPDDDTVVQTRTYDLSITYDKYYQTPRVWLFGYDELCSPLTPEQTFEDIIEDYARRTVTIDPHPHLTTVHASVHPCRHAATMKRIVDNLVQGGTIPRPDQYIFIFLKFIGSVVPTIEYDYTMEITAKT